MVETITLTSTALSKLAELAALLSRASALAYEISASECPTRKLTTPDLQHPSSIPDEQAWFWEPSWLAGERQVNQEIAAGEVETFDTMEDAIAALHQAV